MKQLKKTLLTLLCVGMLFGMTACGSNDTANDNVVNDATEGNNTEQDRIDKNKDEKRNSDHNTDNDGVLEDVGRGVDNGVRDVVDGVEEGVEDMTGQSNTDRANHAEMPDTTNNKDTMNREKTGQ